jgi:arylsulfatase A-like enzyme
METDWVVGQVMEALETSGRAKNTLIFFSTDNGTSPGGANFKLLESHGIDLHHHFKGHKRQIHEGGHRVPFVARWPGTIPAGSTCDETIGLNDFMATVADLLKVELPDTAAEDSFSILPLLTGKTRTLPDHPSVVNHDINGGFAIRRGKWKLIPGSKTQLFDLEIDPKEGRNVASSHPEVVKALADRLKRYRDNGRSTPRK